jgi:hypothetical protein
MSTDVSTEIVRSTLDYLPPSVDPKAVEQALLVGDLSQMTDEVRIAYYIATCRSVGLNPLTKPFQALKGDDGKVTLYPDKGCAEQLRKLHRVSVQVVGREFLDDLYVVTVRASLPDGRQEEAQGAVPMAKAKGTWEQTREGKRYFRTVVDSDGKEVTIPLTVAERAAGIMRAETKAKRRVTLAICGLGLPDWDQEPGQSAHPMALTLQGPATLDAERPLAETIADVYGEGSNPTAAAAFPQAPSVPSTAQDGPVSTATGEILPLPETQSGTRGTGRVEHVRRREPTQPAPEADAPPQGESPPLPQMSTEDLFALEERQARAAAEKGD